jgi:hypothetical protein
VNHRGHQAQHAARALELHQRRPVVVESVEDFGMDREGGLNAPLAVAGAAIGREFGRLRSVEIGEGTRGQVALLVEIARDRLEQASAHDLETIFRRRRPPRGFHAPDDVAEAVERLTAANAADLHVVRLRMR